MLYSFSAKLWGPPRAITHPLSRPASWQLYTKILASSCVTAMSFTQVHVKKHFMLCCAKLALTAGLLTELCDEGNNKHFRL